MNYFYLTLTFLIILVLVILGVQNTDTFQINFLAWEFQSNLSTLIFYSAILGAAAVSILSLPKLAQKHFSLKRSRKELNKLRDAQ